MLSYNRTGDVIEIIVRDASFKKTEVHKFNSSDTKVANRILGHLEKKYGFKPTIPANEAPKADDVDFLDLKVDW